MSKIPSFNAIGVLELACAAQRYNGGYVKANDVFVSSDNQVMATVHPNKTLMLHSLGESEHGSDAKTFTLHVTDADKQLAADIKKHFRKLMFSAVMNDNEFYTTLNIMFTNNQVPLNKFGYFAALPSVYIRDYAETQFDKKTKELSHEHLGLIGEQIEDRDCEVLEIYKSKTYDAYNITAIIDNHLVSWMGKNSLNPGPCVVIKAKIKGYSEHFKKGIPLTRLNYVRAFQ
jgi:hypothetical protein